MRRTIVDFAVRTTADLPLNTLAAELERALSCSFRDGRYHGVPALVADVIGLEVALLHWGGVGGRPIFRLDGEVQDPRFVDVPPGETLEIDALDISPYLADVLTIRTGHDWYVPTDVDRAAEQEHAKLIDEAFE
jgi:hypothetical protein